MKRNVLAVTYSLALVCIPITLATAADKARPDRQSQRLKAADKNGDGKLTSDEIGDTAWKRIASFDANADGVLDAAELTALAQVKGGDRKEHARPGGANSSFTIKQHAATNGHTLRYSLFVPPGAPDKLPLVLCLHGAGGNTAAANLLASPESQKKHPCIVLAPGCEGRSTRWVKGTFRASDEQRAVLPELLEALDAVIRDTQADAARVYVTGQSMGGVGTWGVIAAEPTRFAAAVPVCGHWSPDDAKKIAQVPIWAFHGAQDPTVPVEGTRGMIAAIKAAGGSPKYTEFPDVGHGSWNAAYDTQEMWHWMFQQHR